MLVSKLHSGTSKTKAGQGGLVALFWKSHCATCSPACVILYHLTGSCKGPIADTASGTCNKYKYMQHFYCSSLVAMEKLDILNNIIILQSLNALYFFTH